jgi:ATP-binding cassette subfamily B (MDR/TAP) protein 1
MTVFYSVLLGAYAIGQAGPSLEALARGQGAAAKIYATIDRKSQIDPSSSQGKRLKEVKGDIELVDVTFRYPTRPENLILR